MPSVSVPFSTKTATPGRMTSRIPSGDGVLSDPPGRTMTVAASERSRSKISPWEADTNGDIAHSRMATPNFTDGQKLNRSRAPTRTSGIFSTSPNKFGHGLHPAQRLLPRESPLLGCIASCSPAKFSPPIRNRVDEKRMTWLTQRLNPQRIVRTPFPNNRPRPLTAAGIGHLVPSWPTNHSGCDAESSSP